MFFIVPINKIAIIGGTGKVGRYIADRALQNGYEVRMLVRNPEKYPFIDERMEIVEGNVQENDHIYSLLTDGQPVKETPVYSQVTEKILEVMKELNITRYIGVTGGSLTIDGDHKSMTNKIGAKLFKIFYSKLIADKQKEWHHLRNNKLINWTLIRLPFIENASEIGSIKESLVDMPGTKITNQDIATFIIQQIEDQQYFHRAPFIAN